MKKILLLLLLLIIIGSLGVWKKDEIKAKLWPEKVINPLSGQPVVYELVGLLEKSGIPVTGAPILSNGTIQASISGMIVMFANDKNLFSQVRSLQLLLARLKMEDRIVKEIDLRFNKVVLRY